MDSILTSVKKLLGLTEEYTAFDADLIMHINSVLMILRQMGVGPPGGLWHQRCNGNMGASFARTGQTLKR